MSTTTPDELPKAIRLIGTFWPILITLLIGGASVVQAQSTVTQVERRVVELEVNGSPSMRERLARIEANQSAQTRQLDRIENALEATAKGH